MPKLGVNIDHVATLREARKGKEPDPIYAARVCEKAGCDSIVCHLREDRRHINDLDVRALKRAVRTRLNLEMSVAEGIVGAAKRIMPDQATLVPERRREVTTEGGLDVVKGAKRIRKVVHALKNRGIEVSLFIDPEDAQIMASKKAGVKVIELHTGEYANARKGPERRRALGKLNRAAKRAQRLGLVVNAGHGLNCENVRDVANIKGMNELNIGHSIIARSVFTGLESAVEEMVGLVK